MRSISRKSLLAAVLIAAQAWAIAPVLAATVTVSAASSLTNAFAEIAHLYAQQNPGDKAQLNFGASGSLLQQLRNGAPVDVFASADQISMDQAQADGLIDKATRKTFVHNSLVLIYPAVCNCVFNSLDALKNPAVRRIAIGNPDSVPAGRYAKEALQAAGDWQELNSKLIETQNVRQALDYVARNEVNAGFVYASDAAMMPNRVVVGSTIKMKEPVSYAIALTSKADDTKAAEAFVRTVMSPQGQKILAHYGFTPVAAATATPGH